MTENKSHTHHHAVPNGETRHGHDHAQFHKPTKEEGWLNRYRETRQTKRQEKDLKIIFNRALRETKKRKIDNQKLPKKEEISPKVIDVIAETAERIGKDDILLDLTFSDEQLHLFSKTFTTLHTELHEKYKKRQNISNVLKRTIVGGNLGIGIAEAFTAGGASAMYADGVHNLADAWTYNEQLNNVQEPDSPKAKSYRRRKATYTILSASSALLAAKSGIDIVWDTDASADPLAIYTAGGSVAFNAGIAIARYRQMRAKRKAGNEDSHHDSDVNKHLLVDSASAVLAFVGATAGSGIVGPLAGIVSGGLGAKLFFPSKNNLLHSYHAHGGDDHHHEQDHDHKQEHHDDDHHHEKKKPKKRRVKQAIAAVASTAILAGVGIAGVQNAKHVEEPEQRGNFTPSISLHIPEQKQPAIALTEKTTIKKGGNLWETAEEKIEQTTGKSKTSVTDVVVDYAIMRGNLKKPDVIAPGEYALPSDEVIQVIFDAQTNTPQTAEEKQFADDLSELNKGKPSVKNDKDKKRFTRMKNYLTNKLKRK